MFCFCDMTMAVDTTDGTFTEDCKQISNGYGIDSLSNFKRIKSVYNVKAHPRLWRFVNNSNFPPFIPALNYGHTSRFVLHRHVQGKGIRLSDDVKGVTVDVYTVQYQIRQKLSMVTPKAVLTRYGDKSLFSYLDESLGIYTDGFCANQSAAQSIAMFMASIYHLSAKDHKYLVYPLTSPKGLLLIQDETDPIYFSIILPANDKDSLTEIRVQGSARYVKSIISSVTDQESKGSANSQSLESRQQSDR